jgi:tRNA pseudouridine38-40 synthase
VAHIDVPAEPDDFTVLQRRINGVLSDDVVLREICVAPDGFDARFAALGRHYVYQVTDHPPDPRRRRDTVGWPRRLDVDAMHRAAQGLVGEHDFAAYCKPREGATTVRTLRELAAARDAHEVIVITAHADAFCHNQVRSMVGALLAVGDGRQPVNWPAQVLAGGVRDSGVTVAPAHGLTLLAVDYPPDDQLAARAVRTRERRA